jgi:hypothetical protein
MTLRAPYLDDGDVRLYVGDCVEVMQEMDAESVDAVVCDPPYSLWFMGKEWDRYAPPQFAAWCEAWAREALRVLKPGGHLLAFGGTRTFHRLTCGIENAGFEIRDCLSWLYGSGFPKSLDVSKAIDKAAGAEREVVGMGAAYCPHIARGERCPGHPTADRSLAGLNIHAAATAPASDAAREWQGWGTALKPAWEPCVVARKPLAGTVADNVQAHGTGALNVDGCRIAGDMSGGTWGATQHSSIGYGANTAVSGYQTAQHEGGRWPANVALDEDAAAMLDAQSGERPSPKNAPIRKASAAGSRSNSMSGPESRPYGQEVHTYADTGGASRFFYTAKASRADRTGGGVADNTHPTVKPTDLMRWLVRLVTPPGGLVLDPFAGSGSTLVAARAEGVRAVGIEREDEYARIIADRLAQLSLFSEGMNE